jgi:hypothetical protein
LLWQITPNYELLDPIYAASSVLGSGVSFIQLNCK